MANPDYFNIVCPADATTSQGFALEKHRKLTKVSVAPLTGLTPQQYVRITIHEFRGDAWAFLLKEGYPSIVGGTPRFINWEGEFDTEDRGSKLVVSINNELQAERTYRVNFKEAEI